MFQKTKLNRCLLTAFGGAAALSSSMAFGQAQLERVEVTGSRILSLNAESSAPIQVLTSADIAASGEIGRASCRERVWSDV